MSRRSEYAAWGVQVVAASADTEQTRDQVVKFVRERRLSFPVWTGATQEQMLAFGLGEELPGTAIIDRDGRVVARFTRIIEGADLEGEIDALLKQQHSEHSRKPAEGAADSSAESDLHGHGKAGEPLAAKGRNTTSLPVRPV